ncbi:MAG: hypothetical protein AAB489_00710, partial [Patescibacteria group bacterium]
MANKEAPKTLYEPGKDPEHLERLEAIKAAKERRLVEWVTAKAAIFGDRETQRMIEDERTMQRILAIPKVLDGGAVIWMPEKAREFLAREHENMRREESDQHAKEIQIHLESFLNEFRSFAETMDNAKKLYEDNVENKDIAPKFSENFDAIRATMTSVPVDTDALNAFTRVTQNGFSNVVIAAGKAKTNEDFRKAVAAYATAHSEIAKKLAELGVDAAPLEKKKAVGLIREALVTESQSKIGLGADDQKKIRAEISFINTRLEDLQIERERIIASAFEAGNVYRRMLGGADVDQLIKNAMIDDKIIDLKKLAEEYKKKRGDDRTVEKITAELRAAGGFKKEPFVLTEKERTKLALYLNRHILNPFEVIATSMAENKTIDLEKLQLSLLYLGVSIEIPELQAAANIAGMRGILSDEGQKKLIELLESKGIDNPVGISIKQLLLRAGFPEPVIAEFEKADYRPPLWVMGGMSRIEGFEGKITGLLFRKIINLAGKEDDVLKGNERFIRREDFVDAFTFAFLEKGLTKENVTNARTKAEKLWENLKSAVSEHSRGELVINLDTAQAVIDAGLTIDVSEQAKEYVTMFRDQHLHELPWDEALKGKVMEGYNVTITGLGKWWEYINTLPKVFYEPKLDPALLRLVNQEKAYKTYQDALQSSIKETKDLQASLAKALLEIEEAELSRQKELGPLAPNADWRDHLARSKELLFVSKEILLTLEERYRYSTLPLDVQDKAFWLAMHKGMDAATAYLDADKDAKPKAFETYAKEYEEFDKGLYLAEKNSGRDVLTDLHRAGFDVLPQALDILNTTQHPTEKVPLAVSSARVGNWLNEPEKARIALEKVIITTSASDAQKKALIEAFCTGKDQGLMNAVDANVLVQSIQKHLEHQSIDFPKTEELNARKERFTSPLDVLSSAGKELKKMLRSNNKAEKYLAITMIVAAGYFLWQTWKKGGFGKKLMIGLPLFFGSDILLKRMTGKGVMDRLGLRYMKEEDRDSAVEQYIRRNQKEYGFLDRKEGRAAIQVLMSTEKPIPVKELLAWRKRIAGGTRGYDYRGTAPASLKAGAQEVIAKMGDLEKRGQGDDAIEQKAYEYIFMAFDALCANVATDNALPGPKASKGADLIEKRYVDFSEEYMKEFKRDLEAAAVSKGGYTMLDVLVFERQTPAMREAIFGNDYFLEWVLRGTGISIEWAKQKLAEGKTLLQIHAEWGKEKAKVLYEEGKELLSGAVVDIYDWLRVTYPKAKYELREDWLSVYRLVAGTLSSAGVLIKKHGNDAFEMSIDVSLASVNFTIDTAQNIYRSLLNVGLTGQSILWFDNLCLSWFGFTMSEYILYKDAIEDTPAKRESHVKALAEDKKMFGYTDDAGKFNPGDLERDLKKVAPDVTTEWVRTRFEEAKEKLGLKGVTDMSSYEKLAVYELLKRHIYSHILARRIDAIQNIRSVEGATLDTLTVILPAKFDDLTKDDLAAQIEKSYGLNVISLLGMEKTKFLGKYQEFVKQTKTGYTHDGLDFLNQAFDFIPHRDASAEYLVVINEYAAQFKKEADAAFKELPEIERREKISLYEQYLNTVLANAVIEATMRGSEAERVLPTDLIKLKAEENMALALAIQRAKHFLEFLRINKGASVDPDALGERLKFEHFHAESGAGPVLQKVLSDTELMPLVQSVQPSIPVEVVPDMGVPEGVPKPHILGGAEVALVQEALTKDLTRVDLTPQEEKAMLDALGSANFATSEQLEIRSKLTENATKLIAADLVKPEVRQRYYTYLRAVDGPTHSVKEKELLDYFSSLYTEEQLE